MAGESPDKSEQRTSSGTAPEERDPRLAVFREPSAPADDATAVFRTQAPRGAADDAAESPEASESPAEGSVGSGEAVDGPEEGSASSGGTGEPSGADGAAEAAVTAEADADSEPDADSDADPDADPEPGDVRLRAAVAAWVASGGEEDEAGEAEGSGSGASEDAVEPTDSATSAEPAEPVQPPEPAADDDEPADDDDDDDDAESAAPADDEPAEPAAEPAERAKLPRPTESAESAKPADADGPDAPAAPMGEQRGIDQPTAVFKAIKPAQVDQPTTALKILPPKPKPETPKPETAAERTSTFVPLRSDDMRPTSTPAIGPTVTPDINPDITPGRSDGPGRPAAPSWAASPSAAEASSPALDGAERTRQQPMPPLPPLDLLAELTNTPPPEETPVRTAVRRVKIWTPLVLLLVIVFAIVQMMRPLPEPVLELTAKPSYTFEGSKPTLPWPDEGQGYMAATGLGQVGSFGEQKAVPIGSVAKAMTAYVVLRDHPLKKGEDGPGIKIDAKAESEGGLDAEGESTLNSVKEGDTLTEQEALAAIMIPSANNIARLLARWDAGSEEAFVKKMNDTAKELGMTNTTYTDPSGLNATTVSSAEDQVKLGQKLVEIPALMAITKLPSWVDPSGKKWRNYNTLVPYNGALGIKTGSTTKAGGNLLFAAHKMVGGTDQLIVGAVLGQHTPPIIDTVNAVSQEVMVATQDLLESAKIVKKGQVVGTVDDGFGRTTDVVAAEDVEAVGWSGLTVRMELTDDGKTLEHTAAAGTRVGTLTVGEGASQVKVAVQLRSALTEPAFGDKLTRVG